MPSVPPSPRRLLLALLMLGLLLQAQAGVLRQLLGAAHWHQTVAAPAIDDAGWLARLQAWRQAVQARSLLVGGHGRAVHADHGHGPALARSAHATGHHHGQVARHHHAPHGDDVVALEPGRGDGDPLPDAQAGSLLQPLALAGGWRGPVTLRDGAGWAATPAIRWQDAGLRLPERPPRG